MKRILCILLTAVLLLGLASCASLPAAERRIRKRAHVDIDLAGCRIEKETDTHGGFFGDGEYLLVLDCGGNEEKILAQTREWSVFPLSDGLQEVLYEWGSGERNEIPRISSGAWFFYDRFPDTAAFDRHSDELLRARGAENFSLLLYDSDHGRLYYYEMDT